MTSMLTKLKQWKEGRKQKKRLEKEKVQNERLHQDEMNKLVPVARKVLKIIAESNLDMGDLGKPGESRPQAYIDASLKIIQVFLEDNVLYTERDFVFQLVYQTFEWTKGVTLQSLQKSMNMAMSKVWGGRDLDEISIRDVDEVLKDKTLAKPWSQAGFMNDKTETDVTDDEIEEDLAAEIEPTGNTKLDTDPTIVPGDNLEHIVTVEDLENDERLRARGVNVGDKIKLGMFTGGIVEE